MSDIRGPFLLLSLLLLVAWGAMVAIFAKKTKKHKSEFRPNLNTKGTGYFFAKIQRFLVQMDMIIYLVILGVIGSLAGLGWWGVWVGLIIIMLWAVWRVYGREESRNMIWLLSNMIYNELPDKVKGGKNRDKGNSEECEESVKNQ